MSVTTEHVARKQLSCGGVCWPGLINPGERYRRLVVFPGEECFGGSAPEVFLTCWMCVVERAEETLRWVRDRYDAPVYLDGRVAVGGREGVIWGGSDGGVLVCFDGDRHPVPYHPTDLQYRTVESGS